jgi:DNA-binding beta-propeller fold protein YncE
MTMTRTRDLWIGGIAIGLLGVLGAGQRALDTTAMAQSKSAVQAPIFQVDPLWPKPLPNHWLIGSTIGVSADAQDHIWIVHRPDTLVANETGAQNNPPTASCCIKAPPVLEFDQAGNLIGHWGGPGQGYEWPQSNHGITVDYKGNVWIGGNGQKDGEVLKFTQEGKFLLQIGHFDKSKGSLDTENLHQAAKIYVDPGANEAYISDGYGNHRVIVFDADTGAYKRMLGAYGNKPEDTNFGRYNPSAPPLQQFRNPVHCSEIAKDGLVYVCDRTNDRIQVFHKDGTFVKEAFIQKTTLASGSVWDIAFSKDPQQKYIYLADGSDEKVFIILRDTLEVVSSFGDGGRWPGTFFGVHSIATDSKGNIYTTETYEGKRVQRFLYKGMGPVRNPS